MNNKERLQQELKQKIKPGVKPSDLKKQRGEILGSILTPPPLPKTNPTPQPAPAKIKKIVRPNSQPEGLFSCFFCQQKLVKKLIRLVDKSNNLYCRDCVVNMLQAASQQSGEKVELRKKTQVFSCAICRVKYSGRPHRVHVANFSEQGINPRELVKVCSNCLNKEVVLADLYCPRTSEGRDTWNPKEPEFDCLCPRNSSPNIS